MSGCRFKKTCDAHKDSFKNFPEHFVKLIENHYCNGNETKCARYIVGKQLGRDKIPPTLKPNDTQKAKKLIK